MTSELKRCGTYLDVARLSVTRRGVALDGSQVTLATVAGAAVLLFTDSNFENEYPEAFTVDYDP